MVGDDEGMLLGWYDSVGLADGVPEGATDPVGSIDTDGSDDGAMLVVGSEDGWSDGRAEGWLDIDGAIVGDRVGVRVGMRDGSVDGSLDGCDD